MIVRNGCLEPELFPGPQQDFYNAVVASVRGESSIRRFVLAGAAQSGKSTVGASIDVGLVGEMMAFSRKTGKKHTAWVVAPDYVLADRMLDLLNEMFPPAWVVGYNKQKRIFTFLTGDKLQIRTAGNPEQLRAEPCIFIHFDELSAASEKAYLNCWLRVARYKGIFLATTTPCNVMSPWLTEEFFQHADDPAYFWCHAKIEDNLWMDKETVADLRKRFPGEYALEELDGRFVRSRQGLVYPMFDARTHIIDNYTPTNEDTIVAGADQGSNHPFVYLRAALHPGGGATIFSELYLKDTAPSDQVKRVKADPIEARVVRRWFDPSGRLTRSEFHKAGLSTRMARNNVHEGIRAGCELLHKPGGLRITRSCINLIKEFGLYAFKRDTASRKGDEPLKINDDGMDTFRYIVYSENLPSLGGVVSVSTRADAEKDLVKRQKRQVSAAWDKESDALVLVADVPPYMVEKKKKRYCPSPLFN